jgi:hypothetical protein
MLLSEMKKKQKKLVPSTLLLSLLLLGACKQNDFYEKAGLSEIGDEYNLPPGSVSATDNDPHGLGTPTPTPTPTSTSTPSIVLQDKQESFTQNLAKNGDVDILWVIDDSGSMADNQTALANNFSSFINSFLLKDVDFKMSITTTDGSSKKNGLMVCDPAKLGYSAAIANKTTFIDYFKKCVKVGTAGSGMEQGLKTAKSFMDRYSSSFLRKDAYLAIVFISDEEDQSEKTVAEYLNFYKSLKTNPAMVKAYSVVTQKILPSQQWESVGFRYNHIAEQTSGLKGDLDENFAVTLNNIGTTISNLTDTFAINGKPYQNIVQVFVNGVQKTSGWTYDSVSKVVKFNTNSIPVNGASIVIKYKVQVQ